MRHIFLDSSPLGIISKPTQTAEVLAITNWAASCLLAGDRVYVPEVTDYEIRRELIRAGKTAGIAKLDQLKITLHFLPITSDAMLLAADLWAQSRRKGLATGDPKRLDIDVILAAQALTSGVAASAVIIATTNVSHLSRFVTAELWNNLEP